MKEKGSFILNATICHLITYIICAMLFTAIFNKPAMIASNSGSFLKALTPGIVALGALTQILRGVILAIVLLVLNPIYQNKRLGFLYVWFILVAVGIFCTPSPAPASLHGMVYGNYPVSYSFIIFLEGIIQTGLFSLFICSDVLNKLLRKMSTYQTSALVSALIGGLVYCATHLVLMSITKAPSSISFTRVFDAVLILALMIGAFFVSLWFLRSSSKYKLAISAGLYYLLFAFIPLTFHYASSSPVATLWILLINFIVVGAVICSDLFFVSRLSK